VVRVVPMDAMLRSCNMQADVLIGADRCSRQSPDTVEGGTRAASHVLHQALKRGAGISIGVTDQHCQRQSALGIETDLLEFQKRLDKFYLAGH
jgi:hypothetical protein